MTLRVIITCGRGEAAASVKRMQSLQRKEAGPQLNEVTNN